MRIVAAVCAAFFVTSSASFAQDAKVERGQKLYVDNKCAICHAIGGKGNAKGPLDDVGSKLTAEEIRQWLINPSEMTGKTKATRKPPMPPYAKLSKDDIDAIVAYMQTLKK
jgi:mono/diheme cytochrome c family protein